MRSLKPRVFFTPLASLLAAVILYSAIAGIGQTDADAHRLSGHPHTLKARLDLARRQVAHDRGELAALRVRGWRLLSPVGRVVLVHRYWLDRDVRYVAQLERLVRPVSVTAIICQVFGPYCAQALRVAFCESRYYTGAQNGQFLGLFQMGTYARGRYGHGPDAWTQARAAYRYFAASGYSWGPWECKP